MNQSIVNASLSIDSIIIVGRDEFGPKLVTIGNGQMGSLESLLGIKPAAVAPAIANVPAPVVKTPPVNVAVNATPVVVAPVAVIDPKEYPALFAKAKALKMRGLHLIEKCKAENMPASMAKLAAKIKEREGTPTPTQTNAAPVATQTNAAPQSNAAPAPRRGGKSKGGKGKNEPTLWIPESECFAMGTYTCKDASDKTGQTLKEKPVAVYDVTESSTQGRKWIIAFLTKDARPVFDGKGNPTGAMERHAYEYGTSYLPPIDPNNTGKFTLLQVSDAKTLFGK